MDEWVPNFFFELPQPGRPARPVLDPDVVREVFGADEVHPLGRGSFGETWKVQNGDSSEAVKIIFRENYPAAYLQREVRGLQRVSHERVVRLLDVTDVAVNGKSMPGLVFEFISGGDVSKKILSGQWPSPDEVRLFMRGLLEGVAALHATDTVHRDIKLENIALRKGQWDSPVLLDLGLAKQLDAESVTTYPQLIGTIPYMAPEQVRGEPARKGADIWAVGIVTYLLCTRIHPFYPDRSNPLSRSSALERLMSGPPPKPNGLPHGLGQLICRLLSPQVYRRGSAERALREFVDIDSFIGGHE
jgi:serine/threonine protein kinase